MKTLDRLADQLTIELILPALVLAFMLGALIWVLWRAQKRDDFDVANFLRDESGKESAMRAFAFVALGVTSWIITVMTVRNQLQPEYFLYYCLTWANTIVLVELAKRWNGALPLGSQKASLAGPTFVSSGPTPDATVPPVVQSPPRKFPPPDARHGT